MPLVTEHYHPICFYKCAHGLVYKCSIAVHLLSTKHLLLSHDYQCWQSWILIIFTTHVLIHSPTFAGIPWQFWRSSPEMQSIMLLVWKQCHWPTTIKLPIHIYDQITGFQFLTDNLYRLWAIHYKEHYTLHHKLSINCPSSELQKRVNLVKFISQSCCVNKQFLLQACNCELEMS